MNNGCDLGRQSVFDCIIINCLCHILWNLFFAISLTYRVVYAFIYLNKIGLGLL